MSLTYSQAPYVRHNSAATFGGLWKKADTGVERIGFVGDSRWTAPGGQGEYFHPWIQECFIRRFGQLPETAWGTPSNQPTAGGSSKFCLAQAVQNGSTQWAASYFPPGYSGSGQSLLELYQAGGHGVAFMLDPQNTQFATATYVNFQAGKYFDSSPISGGSTSGTARLWGITYPAGGANEFTWRFTDNTGGTVGYFGTQRATGSTSLGLDAAGFALKSVDITYTVNSSSNFPQFVVGSKNSSPLGAFFGLQYVSATKTNGVVCFPMGVGGEETSSFLANYPNSGGFWRDFPLSAVAFGYGANDGVHNVSVTTYKANTLANIDFIRTYNNLPIFLCPSQYNTGITSSTEPQYAGALNEIVDERPNICFINTRRMLDEQGFNSANPNVGGGGVVGTWLIADGIHSTQMGQQAEAECIYGAMTSLGYGSPSSIRNRSFIP